MDYYIQIRKVSLLLLCPYPPKIGPTNLKKMEFLFFDGQSRPY